jgi:hypothetical protein
MAEQGISETSPNTGIRLGEVPYEDWPDLIMPGELASLFRVDPKTASRWMNNPKKVPPNEVVLTLGGHRRMKKAFVYKMFTGEDPK